MADGTNISISGPICGTIQSVSGAVQSIMEFAATPEGQLTCAAWRESSAKFESAITRGCNWLENLFKGKL